MRRVGRQGRLRKMDFGAPSHDERSLGLHRLPDHLALREPNAIGKPDLHTFTYTHNVVARWACAEHLTAGFAKSDAYHHANDAPATYSHTDDNHSATGPDDTHDSAADLDDADSAAGHLATATTFDTPARTVTDAYA